MILLKKLRVENFKLLEHLDLTFPRQGAVLVEGLNESGKSTLFESIFFGLYGLPLATEGRGRGNLESLIRYGEESASVRLWLEVDQVQLEIHRLLKRGKPTQANLVVRIPGAQEEKVSGVLAVNARVVEELGGLDSEALLNSCFVEQKKLSKLEDLAPAQRKDSIRKLLNLDRLASLAERLRVTHQDEQALALARDRLELAEVSAQLPGIVAEKGRLEEHLGKPGLPPVSEAEADTGLLSAEDNSHPEWADDASRLAECLKLIATAKTRALVLSAIGLMTLAIAIALIVWGVAGAIWALLLPALLALAAFTTYRSTESPAREASQLKAKLALHRDNMVGKIGELEGRRRRLEDRLGVDGRTLDPDQCRLDVQMLARQIEVKRRATALLEGTMERIVRLVLPNTERNMGQILPQLTAGRYHEARIAADYQIEVWDDAAGRYVSKNIFSGGAKDQFSLALRLAFALATLPQELGTTPGFIFLDEPLSSFDGPRTEALINLLTKGQIAESFSQLFVISHNRAFDYGSFRYHLVMREGRVLESNLSVE